MAPLAALIAVLVAAASPDGPLSVGVVSDVVECPSPAEVRSALRQALERMKPMHKEVFVLFELEGIEGQQIARIRAASCEPCAWKPWGGPGKHAKPTKPTCPNPKPHMPRTRESASSVCPREHPSPRWL